MKRELASATAGATVAYAVTAATVGGFWSRPTPQPVTPTFPVSIPIAIYIEDCGDQQQGPCVCTWHSQSWGRFDCKTGKDIPLSEVDKQRVLSYAAMWGDFQHPAYMVSATVPLPDIKVLKGVTTVP